MKIKELMADVIHKIFNENREFFGNRFRRNMLSIIENKAIDLERKATIKKIDFLLLKQGDKEATKENLQPIIDLLSQRWNVVRGTDLAYVYSFRSSITSIYLKIAEILSPILHEHKYKILMPTISTKNEVSFADLNEDDVESIENGNKALQLHEFILSDDDSTLINVLECLQFAKEDMQLKHTHILMKNKMKLLSESEKERVINHTLQSQAHYEAMQQLHDVKVKGANAGAFIRRLIDKLKAGGESGGRDGTANIAGQDASGGIKEFYDFLKTVNKEEKKTIYSCFSTYNSVAMTFELCWLHLLSRAAIENKIEIPEIELSNIIELLSLNPMRSVPCVELIAQDMERIVNNHPELFQLYPENKEISKRVALEMCESRYEETKEDLVEFMKNGNAQLLYKHGEEGKVNLLKQVYGYLVGDITDLKKVVLEIPYLYRLPLFKEGLGKERLESLVKHTGDLKLILESMLDAEFHAELFSFIGNDFIRSRLKNAVDVKEIINVLNEPYAIVFLRDILGKEHLHRVIQTDEEVNQIINSLPKESHAEVISLLGVDPEKFTRNESSSSLVMTPYFGFFSPTYNAQTEEVNGEEVMGRHFDVV
ncbi:MAG: hypothetical protein P4M12_11260 [Gammaproteobacteria bacterium]|nr:hypothetical protein [Gammaproteobacteria bacterium]